VPLADPVAVERLTETNHRELSLLIYRVRPRLAFARAITSARAKMEPPVEAAAPRSKRHRRFETRSFITSRRVTTAIASRRVGAKRRARGATGAGRSSRARRARPFARA
jgi:hypothetical protein